MAGFEEEFEKIYKRYFNDVFLFLKMYFFFSKSYQKTEALQKKSQAKLSLRQCIQ